MTTELSDKSPQFQARVQELQSHWKKAQQAAHAIGYIKPDDQTWDEAAVVIAEKELEQGRVIASVQDLQDTQSDRIVSDSVELRPVTTDFTVEPESANPQYTTEFYRRNNIPYCEACGEQELSDDRGLPMCPEKRADCPRLQPVLKAPPVRA